MLENCAALFFTFLKLGFLSFGGGYAMLSMIISEAKSLGISGAQIADLYALDMVVPGPIAVNGATYMGYLYQGIWGALAATIGVAIPSFILTVVLMRLFSKYQESTWLPDILSGIKPATVGLIASAALTIAAEVLVKPGQNIATVFSAPLETLSITCVIVFIATAFVNLRFKVNPILLIVLSGIAGAIFMA